MSDLKRYKELEVKINSILSEMREIHLDALEKASGTCYTRFSYDKDYHSVIVINHGFIDDFKSCEFKMSLLRPYDNKDNFFLSLERTEPLYEEVEKLLQFKNDDLKLKDEEEFYIRKSPSNKIDLCEFYAENHNLCYQFIKKEFGIYEGFDKAHFDDSFITFLNILNNEGDWGLLNFLKDGDDIDVLNSFVKKQKVLFLENSLPRNNSKESYTKV